MKSLFPRGKVAGLGLVSLALLGIVGCGVVSPLISGAMKVASGQMNTLTAPEILALQEFVAPGLDLTAEQAEVISDVLAALGAGTIPELQEEVGQIIAQIEADPGSLPEILDELGITEEDLELFIDLVDNFDVSMIEDIVNLGL